MFKHLPLGYITKLDRSPVHEVVNILNPKKD